MRAKIWQARRRPRPAGVIEIYYPSGLRCRVIPAGGDMLLAALEAHDIWEQEEEQIRIRVVKFLPGGKRYCICHLPPVLK